MRSLKNCFNCEISQNGEILHNKDYITLRDISDDIGLSYSIIADISSGRKKNQKYNNFKFMPKIKITRLLNKTNNNMENTETLNQT
jgi:hypothetical protein